MSEELTAAQVAERLGVGRSTVNLWCRQGRFPSARVEKSPVGEYWLIPESDLKHFRLPKRGRIPKAAQPVNGTHDIEWRQEMKNKNIDQSSRLSARMVEPEATERLKQRARDMGLIVNAGARKTTPPIGKKKATKK